MTARIYLRIASVLTLVHAILHTVGGVYGSPVNSTAAQVVATMQANSFPMMGVTRTYAEFYRGMGLGITIFLTAEGIVFWLLASLAKTDAARLRPILAVFLLGYLAFAVNSLLYFFLAPVITEILIALALGMAILTAKSPATVERQNAAASA
ncbi:MAG TPA: hypothetical protein VKR52_19315 [Terracidiphilus sp.]|nr:hypothetical protein [Terracidiphilus sp.]